MSTVFEVTYWAPLSGRRLFDTTADEGEAFGECFDLQEEGFQARVERREETPGQEVMRLWFERDPEAPRMYAELETAIRDELALDRGRPS